MSAPRIAVLVALAALAACSRPPAAGHAAAVPSPSPAAAPGAAAPASPPPAPPMGYETRLGHDIFAHYCATCHGDAGAGDGFNAYNLDPHPRDLSDPAFQAKTTDAQLADAINRGGAGVGLSNLMPPWGHTLSKRQVDQVVAFIRTLRKKAP